MKFAASVVAQRIGNDLGLKVRHSVFMVEAVSKDEAVGKAIEVAKKILPKSDGWYDHAAMVCLDTRVVDPEKDTIAPIK